MARSWSCRGTTNEPHDLIAWPRVVKKCRECGRARPRARKPQHQMVLELPYETWVARFGERCGICGRPPGPNRRLDRDHDHRTGEARGLLCHRCNRAMPSWVTVEWLLKAIAYLKRHAED